MNNPNNLTETIHLDRQLSPQQCWSVIQGAASLNLTADYLQRVAAGHATIQGWIENQLKVYGVTTGFGELCQQSISPEQTHRLQENILRSHAISVGTPMSKQVVRSMMLMMLLNAASGQTGMPTSILERLILALNADWYPYIPAEGSVGYLNPEAFLGAALLLGEGQFFQNNQLISASDFLRQQQVSVIAIPPKAGLSFISSTNSVCAYAFVALQQMEHLLEVADLIGACSIQTLGAQVGYLAPEIHAAKPHPTQQLSAQKILAYTKGYIPPENTRLQEALSIRAIAQVHGAVRKSWQDAWQSLLVEMFSCGDNPLLVEVGPNQFEAQSNANPDSTMIGLLSDQVAIATATLAKCTERRTARLLDGKQTNLPSFLAPNSGLESGLMIAHYTQVGLLNKMKHFANPSSLDNSPTSGLQEDYVTMSYYATQKLLQSVETLAYVLAIELVCNLQAYRLRTSTSDFSPSFHAVFKHWQAKCPTELTDTYWQTCIEALQQDLLSGNIPHS